MPRYFFNVRDGQKLFADSEGQDFPDVLEARSEAARTANEIMDQQALPDTPDGWLVDICDESGATLDTLGFADARTLRP